MKYYIIAGEASGDLHGSNLIKSLHQLDNQAVIHVWGGDLMQSAGATLRKHYRDLAFMGFIEVVKNLSTILKNIRFCKQDIQTFQPDVIIFIDYPGFNLRIAKWAKQQNMRTFYYISPQIWAWHTSRVHGIKATVDKMFCILPFEKDFYQKYGYEVDYVGHPLLDVIENRPITPQFREKNNLNEKPIIALLPGSRRQEITTMLPLMLLAAPQFADYQFVIAAAPSQPLSFYNEVLKKDSHSEWANNIKIIEDQTYDLLQHATAALVKSGTSTLETALFGVPQVVCYKGSPISYAIAKRVIKVKYISLVNLIADKVIVKELIQAELTTENIVSELRNALDNQDIIKKEYTLLRGMLGNAGASERAAKLMVGYLQNAN
jgi:lipid-A-disaccharide synthase